jgi:hypothetical protein
MPWYRMPDGQNVFHMCVRGPKGAPKACRAPRFPDDNPAHGESCGRMSTKLCDGKVADGGAGWKSTTCDMPICDRHATHVNGKDLDYCPRHAAAAPASLPLEPEARA